MRYRRSAQRRKYFLFNALTKAGIEAANFSFCTIEPNTDCRAAPIRVWTSWLKLLNRSVSTNHDGFVDIADHGEKARPKAKGWVGSS